MSLADHKLPREPSPTHRLTAELKGEALRLGFSLAGACPAVAPPGLDHLHAWLAAGYAGEMGYFESRREAYAHPNHVLPGARSLLVLGFKYLTVATQPAAVGQGRVSRYGWGEDYHDLVRDRLNRLADWFEAQRPGAAVRGVVDTAPLLEGEFARLAGLGWIGKNTLLLNRTHGSWFFLSVLLTDQELAYDEPYQADHCGTCRACLDACPTGAFVAPYMLDARRCISYLTIEARSPVPPDLRSGVGDWVLGCDVCQDVCPWNQRVTPAANRELEPRPSTNPLELIELFELDDAAFRTRYRQTPFWRPRRRGVLRNAAIVLGNQRCQAAVEALARGLDDCEALVRGACAWALGAIGGDQAREALERRAPREEDAQVLGEISEALAAASVGRQELD